jgi:tripartite-type tricarboxylate transporter receptor subunit TctC
VTYFQHPGKLKGVYANEQAFDIRRTIMLLVGSDAMAQSDYPNKSITMHNSFLLHGSSGLVGELMAARMEERLGQKIEMKGHEPGRSGNIATEFVAAAAADGYTLLMGTVGNIAWLQNIWQGYPIDPLEALSPITKITDTPDVLIAHPSAPFDTFEEFVAYAKANPGAVQYSDIARPSIHRAEFEAIIGETGIALTLNKDIRGSANAMKAIADGRIQVTLTTVPYILPLLQANKVKALALASEVPSVHVPNVPLFREVGVEGVPRGSWNGLLVPAATPQPIIDTLFDAIKYAVEAPEVKNAIEELGMRVDISQSPHAFRSFLEAEANRFAMLAKKYDIVID